MHRIISLHRELPLVHSYVVTDDPIPALPIREQLVTAICLICEGTPGYQLPDADAYAKRLAEEAEAWLQHARARSRMKDETLVQKAFQSLAFSFRHRAHDLAVPTKLSGTSKHQKALWQLTRERVGFGTPLDIGEVQDGKHVCLIVSYEGETLGEIQAKHVGWLRPLLPFGAGVWLTRITGQEERFTLGCNIALGRVGSAVTALNHALGHDVGGDGYGGDGAATAPAGAAPAKAPTPLDPGGDGAKGRLRLVTPNAALKATPMADPADVVLFRDIDGTARATVEHVARHSPSGIEWGYHGSGPADLARSILLVFTGEATVERLYQDFKAEIVARIPMAGGVIRTADIRTWLAARGTDQR